MTSSAFSAVNEFPAFVILLDVLYIVTISLFIVSSIYQSKYSGGDIIKRFIRYERGVDVAFNWKDR